MAASPGFRIPDSLVEIDHQDLIGNGSYGKICKAKYGLLPCAAKLLHAIFFADGDPGGSRMIAMFRKECWFLNNFKHPNIVQGLGITTDPSSNQEALLMELMDRSLTSLLETSSHSLSYHSQIGICYDVSQALSYIHSIGIMHRDVTSNNILMKANTAKLTDFGVSSRVHNDTDSNMQLPTTLVYCAPEARDPPCIYDCKIDCFSFGVVVVQVITRQFPLPDLSMHGFDEIARRRNHISLIDPDHPLLPLALQCLKDTADLRPSATQFCQKLSTLKSRYQLLSWQDEHEASEAPRKSADENEAPALTSPVNAMKDYQIIGMQYNCAIGEPPGQVV